MHAHTNTHTAFCCCLFLALIEMYKQGNREFQTNSILQLYIKCNIHPPNNFNIHACFESYLEWTWLYSVFGSKGSWWNSRGKRRRKNWDKSPEPNSNSVETLSEDLCVVLCTTSSFCLIAFSTLDTCISIVFFYWCCFLSFPSNQ